MTKPKGTHLEQVQRLRIRAAEAFVASLEYEAGGYPDHQTLREFRELLKDAAAGPEIQSAVEEFNRRLADLERELTGARTGIRADGTMQMG